LKQLFEGFNEFAIINQTGTAALIRLLPGFASTSRIGPADSKESP
jgi:hypothetical protein